MSSSTSGTEDTIAAIATPAGEGGISVIRLSGPRSFEIVGKMFRPAGKKSAADFSSHTVHLGHVLDESGAVLDQVLVTFFKSPHSYTAENVAEISSHGGYVVTRKILACVIRAGARPAEPGEFTKRAFLNGKIDLAQAEAVLDLIKAKSDKSLQVAVRQLAGDLSAKFKTIKNDLMRIYAHLEAFVDFPEEELEIFSDQHFKMQFVQIRTEIQKLVSGFARGALIREGITVALVGKPNVGKSSLFNALLSRDRAIVSEIPGTTRDVLEEAIEIQGWYLRLADTAGLATHSGDPVEKIGMERTRHVMESAGIFLFVVDGSEALSETDRYVFEHIPAGKPVLILVNKSDLPEKISMESIRQWTGQETCLRISTRTRAGLDQLESQIADVLARERVTSESEQVTRLRHKLALEEALEALIRAEKLFEEREPIEVLIVDLKTALDAMRELIGEVYSEDLLDVIFAEFCIGK